MSSVPLANDGMLPIRMVGEKDSDERERGESQIGESTAKLTTPESSASKGLTASPDAPGSETPITTAGDGGQEVSDPAESTQYTASTQHIAATQGMSLNSGETGDTPPQSPNAATSTDDQADSAESSSALSASAHSLPQGTNHSGSTERAERKTSESGETELDCSSSPLVHTPVNSQADTAPQALRSSTSDVIDGSLRTARSAKLPNSSREKTARLRDEHTGDRNLPTCGSDLSGSDLSGSDLRGEALESEQPRDEQQLRTHPDPHASKIASAATSALYESPQVRIDKPNGTQGESAKLHRIREVREQQGVSVRSMARRMNLDIRSYRRLEDPACDLTISELNRVQKALEVPLCDLLVDRNSLSRPVEERAKLVKAMKTAVAIREAKGNSRILRLAKMLCEQLTDLMPELADVSGWPQFGARRGKSALGKALCQPIDMSNVDRENG